MAKFVPVDTFDLVIFGGAGDLALRKLLPALYHRDLDGQLPAGSRIISLGRRAISREQFLEKVCDSLCANLKGPEYTEEFWRSFSSRLQYVRADALEPSGWQDLCRNSCWPLSGCGGGSSIQTRRDRGDR